MNKPSNRIEQLDGMRGIFSLMIVFFHYKAAYLPEEIYGNFFIRHAYLFVDFFFVLSGFVIAYNYHNIDSNAKFWVYLKKRFIRLYPLLFYTTTIYFAADLVANYYFPSLINQVDSFWEIFKRYLDTIFFTNSTPILGNDDGANYPSWSVSAEMISYLVYGALYLFTLANHKRAERIAIGIILGGIAFRAYRYFFLEGDYSFVNGLVSFHIGYIVWRLSHIQIRIPAYLEYVMAIGLVLLLYLASFLDHSFAGHLLKDFISLFFGLSIFVFLRSQGSVSRLLSTRAMTFLGDVSYSVYLNHAIVVLVVPAIVFDFFKVPQNTFSEIAMLFITVVIILVYSAITRQVVERQGGNLLRKRLLPHKPT